MKSNRFIINSDLATLKNDSQSNSISFTVTSGTRIYESGGILNVTWGQSFVNAGTPGAALRSRIICSLDNRWMAGISIVSIANATLFIAGFGTIPTQIQIYGVLDKISNTQVRLIVFSQSTSVPTGSYMQIDQTVTISAVFSTFLSPFN